MDLPRPKVGAFTRLGRWVADAIHLPFDKRWQRPTHPGRHRALFRLAGVVLALVALSSLVKSLQWRLTESNVQIFLAVWWGTILLAAFVIWRALHTGLWVGRGGVRIEWLFHREIIPWHELSALWVVPAPVSFAGRIERLVIETTGGERVTVQGTDSYLHRFFRADLPDAVRHAIERERRFYAGPEAVRRRVGRSSASTNGGPQAEEPGRAARAS